MESSDEDDQVDVWCSHLEQRQPRTELRRCLAVKTIGDVMRRRRLKWLGHVERKEDADYAKACTRLVGWWWREGTCEQAEEHLAEHSCTRLVVEGRHL